MATPNPNLIYRTDQTNELTFAQLDGNFAYLSQSIADITSVESASYALNADNALTASYVDAANIDGQVASALNANNAATASYVDATNVNGQVASAANADNAATASYVDAVNIDGQVASALNADTSSYVNTLNQDVVISGSILISGSIIPDTDGVSTTSSFDLGSPTNAWKDIYVSNGTINFLDSTGAVVQTMGTGNNQLTGDTFIDGKLRQGFDVTASGPYSHAEGTGSKALGIASHAEGRDNIAGGYLSGISAAHAEGRQTTASGRYSHTEGYQTYALGESSHAEGTGTFTNGTAPGSHAEGYYSRTDGAYAHSEGSGSWAWSNFSHAEGIQTYTYDYTAQTATTGQPAIGAHAEGELTITVGRASHAEGFQTYSSGSWSHAEGYQSYAEGLSSHAEGANTWTVGESSHAEGSNTYAEGSYSHAEGQLTRALGASSHAEGLYTTASAAGSHAEGYGTQALAPFQHVSGRWNLPSSADNDLFIVGNGPTNLAKKNALVVKSSGSIALPDVKANTPSWTGVEGEMVFATVTGNHYLYVWIGGGWKSTQLT